MELAEVFVQEITLLTYTGASAPVFSFLASSEYSNSIIYDKHFIRVTEMTSKNIMRLMICSIIVLLVMTATSLVFMIILHRSDLAKACGVRSEGCRMVCSKCGSVTYTRP